tara:strand:+ start:305 stop:481 length:177 start_codon:yes stop_codon:yes gene_type:complete
MSNDWTLEYEACTPHLVNLGVESANSQEGTFTVKVYLDNNLWKEASGNIAAEVQDWLP